MSNVRHCLNCPHGLNNKLNRNGENLPCLADKFGRPFTDLAIKGECPLNKFGNNNESNINIQPVLNKYPIQELVKSREDPEKKFSLPHFNHTVQPVTSQINIKKGVIGLSKWLLRLDRATAKLSLSRLKVCKTCEYNTNGSLPRCKLCGCALLAKTKLQSEKCPAGKW
jgi:hypothetical protein